jgi:hypothetical protein
VLKAHLERLQVIAWVRHPRIHLRRNVFMETTLNRQGGGGAGVIAALQDTAVGKEVCRQKTGCLDDVDHLAPIPKSVAKRIEGLVKVMLLVLR